MQCLEGDASQLDRLLGVQTHAQLGQTEAVGQGGGHLQYRAVQCEVRPYCWLCHLAQHVAAHHEVEQEGEGEGRVENGGRHQLGLGFQLLCRLLQRTEK